MKDENGALLADSHHFDKVEEPLLSVIERTMCVMLGR
jgi:hypothetical protein